MIVIGLVGKIAAGKSTVARRLAGHGAEVIDADRLARESLDEPSVREAIVARFGNAVADPAGAIRRDLLAERVFGPTADHAADLAALEAIIHPRVRQRIEERLAAIRSLEAEGAPQQVVVLDVPLLVQAGWAPACDHLIHVQCEEAVRRRRLADRKLTVDQQAARDAAWSRRFSPADVPAAKTAAVDASGDLAYTAEQIDRIWAAITRSPPSG